MHTTNFIDYPFPLPSIFNNAASQWIHVCVDLTMPGKNEARCNHGSGHAVVKTAKLSIRRDILPMLHFCHHLPSSVRRIKSEGDAGSHGGWWVGGLMVDKAFVAEAGQCWLEI